MKLYNYWKSSASWRVRIGLAHKGIAYDYVAVDLMAGEQYEPAYAAISAQGQVPALQLDDGRVLVQSMAILEYLEQLHPTNPLLPADPVDRAHARALAEMINAGIQPLQNFSVTGRLAEQHGGDPATWIRYWVQRGMDALEAQIPDGPGPWLVGTHATLAEVCLVPQMGVARRVDCDVSKWPRLLAAEAAALALPSFRDTAPALQPDAP